MLLSVIRIFRIIVLFLLEPSTSNYLGVKDVFFWILFSKLLYMCFVLMGREAEDLKSNEFFNMISPDHTLSIDIYLKILHKIKRFQKER